MEIAMSALLTLSFLGIALCAYVAGMLGSVAYALFALRSLPNRDGGEGKAFLLVLMFQLVKAMQAPKIALALASAYIGIIVCSTPLGAIGVASALTFTIAGLFLSFVMHRGGND
jgi:hypothetical protein